MRIKMCRARRAKSKRGVRQLPDTASIELGLAVSLQRRAAKAYRHLVGAGLGTGFTDLIGVTRVATTYTDEVLIGPVVGHRSNHYFITGAAIVIF